MRCYNQRILPVCESGFGHQATLITWPKLIWSEHSADKSCTWQNHSPCCQSRNTLSSIYQLCVHASDASKFQNYPYQQNIVTQCALCTNLICKIDGSTGLNQKQHHFYVALDGGRQESSEPALQVEEWRQSRRPSLSAEIIPKILITLQITLPMLIIART